MARTSVGPPCPVAGAVAGARSRRAARSGSTSTLEPPAIDDDLASTPGRPPVRRPVAREQDRRPRRRRITRPTARQDRRSSRPERRSSGRRRSPDAGSVGRRDGDRSASGRAAVGRHRPRGSVAVTGRSVVIAAGVAACRPAMPGAPSLPRAAAWRPPAEPGPIRRDGAAAVAPRPRSAASRPRPRRPRPSAPPPSSVESAACAEAPGRGPRTGGTAASSGCPPISISSSARRSRSMARGAVGGDGP